MKLTNNADKKIKRFLKSVCEDFTESKVYNSIHYQICVNGILKDIRFADHLSRTSSARQEKNGFMEIIKTTETTYLLNYKSGTLQYTASDSEVADIVKSFVILGEIIEEHIEKHKEYTNKAMKIKTKIAQEKDTLLKTIENKNKEIVELTKTISNQKEILSNQSNTINGLNAKLSKTIKDRDQTFNSIAKLILKK